MTAAEANLVEENGNNLDKEKSDQKQASTAEPAAKVGKKAEVMEVDNGEVNKSAEVGSKPEEMDASAENGEDKAEQPQEKESSDASPNGAGDEQTKKNSVETGEQKVNVEKQGTGEVEEKDELKDKEEKTSGAEEKITEGVEEQKDMTVEAAMHLAQGKRHMLVQDFVAAVDSLQKACELLSAQYGDKASECSEALLFYGRALLELHRKQTSALNEIDGSGDTEDSDSDEEAQEGEEEGAEEQEEDKESTSKEDSSEKKPESPKDEEDLEKPEPALQDSKLDGIAEEPAQDIGDTTKNDEDASSDLQIAFEVLDLAKSIFKRDAEKTPELYLKAADCLLSLGEVGLESDNYGQAIEDFEECLKIQQELLPNDSRVMAETYYQLGLTYSFVTKYEKSAAYFSDALQVLKLKVENLKKFMEEEKAKNENRGSLDDDPVWRAEREVEDIEALLPEIQSKFEDAREMQKEKADGPKEKIINQMLNRTPEASPVKGEAKVNVISSNLIKRKRPTDDSGEGTSNAEKKLKE